MGDGFLFQVIVQSYLVIFISVKCSISEILEEFLVTHGRSIEEVLKFNAVGISLSHSSNK